MRCVWRTVSKPLGGLAQDKGEVLGSGTDEHTDEVDIGLDEGGIHRGPGHIDDSFDKRIMDTLKTRDDMGESNDPKAELRVGRGSVWGYLCKLPGVKLVNELVEWITDSLEISKLEGNGDNISMWIIPEL